MPIYEYRCSSCGRRVSILVRGSSTELGCTACGSTELTRLFSSFAVRRPDTAIYDDILSDSYLTKGLMANDPASIAKWSRMMSGAVGDERDARSDEWLGRMDRGIMPTQEEITTAQEEFFSKEPE